MTDEGPSTNQNELQLHRNLYRDIMLELMEQAWYKKGTSSVPIVCDGEENCLNKRVVSKVVWKLESWRMQKVLD